MVKIMFSETSEVTKNNGKEKPETKFSEKKNWQILHAFKHLRSVYA